MRHPISAWKRLGAACAGLAIVAASCTGDTTEQRPEPSATTAATTTIAPSPATTTSETTTTTTSTTAAPDPPEHTWELVLPDVRGHNLPFVTVDIDPSGLPFVTRHDVESHDLPARLYLVTCEDQACRERVTTAWELSRYLGHAQGVGFSAETGPVVCIPPRHDEPWISVLTLGDRSYSNLEELRINSSTIGADMVVLEDGSTLVSYGTGEGQMVLRCDDPSCRGDRSESTIATSFAIETMRAGANGLPLFAGTRRGLDEWTVHLARCLDPACADYEATQVADGEMLSASGHGMAVAPDGAGALLVSYIPDPGQMQQLILLTWTAGPFQVDRLVLQETPLDAVELQSAAVAISSDGTPVVVWRNVFYEWESLLDSGVLKVARCEDHTCEHGTIVTLVGADAAGHVAVTVDHDDNPVIAYQHYDIESHIEKGAADEVGTALIRCADLACESAALDVERW